MSGAEKRRGRSPFVVRTAKSPQVRGGEPAIASLLVTASHQGAIVIFESIVAKITNTIRNVVHGVGAATRKTQWLAPMAILVFFLVL